MTPRTAADWIARARSLEAAGDLAGARKTLADASTTCPGDPVIANAAGNLAMRAGDIGSAERSFAAASKADPGHCEYALNHAIALQRLGRAGEALEILRAVEREGATIAKYGSVRASCAREVGELAEAARWYDAAIARDPGYKLALHGRARVAIERGEADALARFDRALQVNPGEADLWLGKAQALEVDGNSQGARVIAEQLCDQAPGFIAALTFHAGLLLAAGEKDFAAPFRKAAARAPQDPNIAAAHIETLAGLDHAAQAADIAAEARERFPREPHFTLLEAVHAGSAGQWERAEALWAQCPIDNPMRALHEARHRIRSGEIARADALLDRVLAANPWDISGWALRGIVWRLSGDNRAQWLHEQAKLVQLRPLEAREGLLGDVTGELRALHSRSAMPLGQSLRGGTQTRGILFHRTEPLLAELHEAIRTTLASYRADLPVRDDSHPLLRHREDNWRLAGSWSVRLTGGGSGAGDYHTAHIHPLGIVSSALYLVVPAAAHGGGKGGWLEVGRPPPDLGLDLPPLRSIEPQEGHLALFPSTLYHGTTRFGGAGAQSAERMTVAFDVVSLPR
ncbi:putative 2OG-Fe(II) oxygenase [Qipengyuania nanhaisediminis]|uniref:putative 2OG-Fe(II) oxygenase n=1 Tax=Qipengyuania nanhaisediminis TaxID=604088 RepID=UPI0038B36353